VRVGRDRVLPTRAKPVERGILRILLALVFLSTLCCVGRQADALSPGTYYFLFNSNSSDIDAKGPGQPLNSLSIDTLVQDWKVQKFPAKFIIHCYADRVGTEAYNLALSERRCQAVRAALIAGGVPSERIETNSHGEVGGPIPTADEVPVLANRTVEVTLLPE